MGGLGSRLSRWAAALSLSLWSIGTSAGAEPVTVFAAASLKTALDDIVTAFSAVSEEDVVVSYAGSSALARQISLGAPADIMISASADWMDWLEARNAIEADSRVEIASNRLVIVTQDALAPVAATAEELGARLSQGRIAMALVDAVPAGIYGKAALSHLGLWDKVASQVAQTDNVRAALALVATGAAAFGVVYATDAMAEPRVAVLAEFPPESHPRITYPAALVAGGGTPAARSFLAFLQTDTARAHLREHGFLVPGGGA
ncbi:molybdate ABC transporter substrate-binding protein [Roseobacter sinensis]|uniref:Molybdate ABC transporter substrate-binding protein n=1 Tax=Roseobacter sinensis TaxID=2931391 RepID=A0ABT3BHJ3_9RHOB|nr:molybdate ABC transporter substrate-binding protein [Roseobacter sp. WL0113]MCV3273040.1 molybdate ABC transporter substrate-binding protein [Roseobacter sp. WL0113]